VRSTPGFEPGLSTVVRQDEGGRSWISSFARAMEDEQLLPGAPQTTLEAFLRNCFNARDAYDLPVNGAYVLHCSPLASH
jgi:hypothetical protein